ncbi:MAG: toll/interleukin-1 receptor domain-containing protein [Gemmataceae bacterium]
MLRVVGVKTTDGKLHWQTENGGAWPGDGDEGIEISINPMWGGFKKRAKPYLLEVMEANEECWLWKEGNTWYLDLGAVRKRFRIFENVEWLAGIARFHQNSTATHRDPDPNKFTVYKEAYLLEKSQKIFLSHKGADKPLVREYFQLLKTLGFDPWLDEDAMPAGTPLERGILQGFEDSCAAVFFLTPNYVDAGYLATEVEYAVQQRRKKGDRFQIVTIVFKDKKKKGQVPQLLHNYVWKEPESHTAALKEILLALPVAVGPVRWKPDLGASHEPQKPDTPAPIQFRTHDVSFRFIGQDAGGGTSNSTRDKAFGAEYWFKLNVFNPRSQNVGLMDIFVHYAKGGVEVAKHVPGEHTGEIRLAQQYCPDVTALTLPKGEWMEKTFQGGVRAELAKVGDCDEIYLTAKSTTGEEFRIPLSEGFTEK